MFSVRWLMVNMVGLCDVDSGILDAVRGGPLAECVLLGNLAIAAGKKIEWDNDNLKATNAPEVAPFIRREYRKGWEF